MDEALAASVSGIIWAGYYIRDVRELESRVSELERRLAACLIDSE